MKTLAKYVARGGFIPFCDHRCPSNADPDDYLYYPDLKEKTLGIQAQARPRRVRKGICKGGFA